MSALGPWNFGTFQGAFSLAVHKRTPESDLSTHKCWSERCVFDADHEHTRSVALEHSKVPGSPAASHTNGARPMSDDTRPRRHVEHLPLRGDALGPVDGIGKRASRGNCARLHVRSTDSPAPARIAPDLETDCVTPVQRAPLWGRCRPSSAQKHGGRGAPSPVHEEQATGKHPERPLIPGRFTGTLAGRDRPGHLNQACRPGTKVGAAHYAVCAPIGHALQAAGKWGCTRVAA